MIGANHTNKFPPPIRVAIKQFNSDDCYLIKHRVKGVTGSGKVLYCWDAQGCTC